MAARGRHVKIEIPIGARFGRWTVTGESGFEQRGSNRLRVVPVRCDCGTERQILWASLRIGHSTSCGCYIREVTSQRLSGKRYQNEYEIRGDYAALVLTNRKGKKTGETLVSIVDLARVLAVGRWHSESYGYVIHIGHRRTTRLHRFVVNASDADLVDHINRDTKDNRRENLRFVGRSENAQNSLAHRDCRSGVRNVHSDSRGRWKVIVTLHGKTHRFGIFDTIEEAAEVAKIARKQVQSHCPENSEEIAFLRERDSAEGRLMWAELRKAVRDV